jgi:type IV pilus assembly protein PilV
MMRRGTASPAAGFSLVEVLVALVVISVGLLGVAKMQALALSNTSSARLRSLAAIQASSLATAMHADRAYWATIAVVPFTASAQSGVASSADGVLSPELANATAAGPVNYCLQGGAGSVAPCAPVSVAAADLQTWAADLNNLIPNAQATIFCDVGTPLTCKVSLSWVENLVGNYVLYVQP